MTYRIGIIGCGGMGRSHAQNWQQRDDAAVVAAMDISAEARRTPRRRVRNPGHLY